MKFKLCTIAFLFLIQISVYSQNSQIAQLVKSIENEYNSGYGYATTVKYDYQKNILDIKNQYCQFWIIIPTLKSVAKESTSQLVFTSTKDDITGTCGTTGHNREFFNFNKSPKLIIL